MREIRQKMAEKSQNTAVYIQLIVPRLYLVKLFFFLVSVQVTIYQLVPEYERDPIKNGREIAERS